MALIRSFGFRFALILWLMIVGVGCSEDSTPPTASDDTQYQISYKRDYEYLKRTYYDVGKFGADSLGECFHVGRDTIVDFKLFVPGSSETPGDVFAMVAVDPRNLDAYPKNIFGSFVHELTEGTDYFLNPHEFWIRLAQKLGTRQFLACWMVVKTPTGVVNVGEINPVGWSPRYLKMLRATASYPGSPTWDYEWRNVYEIGATDLVRGDIKVDIYRGAPGTEEDAANSNRQDGVRYLELLGLDRYNNAGQRKPDGRVDFIDEVINAERGHLIFPNRKPFDPDTGYSVSHPSARLQETFPELYTTAGTLFIKDLSLYYLSIGIAEEEEEE